MRWYEEGNKLVIEDVDQDAVLLLWVARKYNIDLRVLLFLFDKYGKDLWFFFYLFAGLVVRFPKVERFLKMVKDVQTVFAGGNVNSSIGKFASELMSVGKVELDLGDRRWFLFGRLGLYEEVERNGGEDFVEEGEREVS
jgi:hypothetical protein